MAPMIGRRLARWVPAAVAAAVTAATVTAAGLPAAGAGHRLGTGAARPSAAQPGTARPGGPAPLVAKVQWGACGHGISKPFQCATAPVPLDHRHPSGTKITLSLLRLPASDKAKRIGSLFIDFGGPGGLDITDLVNRAFTVFSP